MPTLLLKNAYIATMDDHQREIPEGGLLIRDGFIEQVGQIANLPNTADEILDLKGHIVLPGLVNTHHHFYQTLTRAVPAAQDANLFNWLKTLYPIWARLTPDDIFISTQTALAELALSGCTTASDHLYLFPNGSKLDDEIAAAKEGVCVCKLRAARCRSANPKADFHRIPLWTQKKTSSKIHNASFSNITMPNPARWCKLF